MKMKKVVMLVMLLKIQMIWSDLIQESITKSPQSTLTHPLPELLDDVEKMLDSLPTTSYESYKSSTF